MGQVNCLYCGAKISDDVANCPACGAPSHYQAQGFRLGARKRFVILFVVFAVIVLAFALLLPR